MAPVIPDCGIFSTPRREPRLKVLTEELEQQPPLHSPGTPSLAQLSLTSPKDALKASDIPTTSGISTSFYKSPAAPSKAHKSPKEPAPRAPPPKLVSKRSKGMEINRGVGHGIKKPKTKLLTEKAKKKKMEATVKKINAKAPYIPANRIAMKSPPVQQKRKLQYLSPPGVSLLNGEPEDSILPEPSSGKFFTSRSRAAATVQISKNIKLSAKYGDVSLNQKGRGFAKKNIGRQLEEKLDQYLQQSRLTKGINEVLPLPSVASTPRPGPTRVPSSPSPTKRVTQGRKRAPSPRKTAATATQKQPSTSTDGELQDMEAIVKEWDKEDMEEGRRSSPRKQQRASASEFNETPQKHSGLSTPTRRSPRKMMRDSCASPLRKSPRKGMGSSCASPARKSPKKQVAESHTPLRGSPRKLQHDQMDSPSKGSRASQAVMEGVSASPRRRSPRKLERPTPKKVEKEEEEEKEEGKPVTPEAQSSKEVKYFPIFYPKTRLSECHILKSKHGGSLKKTPLGKNDTQMMIDAGQKEFGARHCPMCGLLYEVGNPEDEASHIEYHHHMSAALRHNGWKRENLARDLDHLGGRVLVVSSQDSQSWWQKVEEVREVVDNELGFSENSIKTRENTKVFLYVLERQVVGCLIAEKINKAYRVVPQQPRQEDSGRLVCCSQAPTKVWVGISRVWVLQAHRGKGIATTLVDAMRNNMIKNHILSIDQFAFSDPTEVGLSFAEKYAGKPDFLVYRREF
ncbi:N-acetyltransferase ESCO2-like isoform X2 [Eriocheir sinensis]|uniref:N-acetyltransferase ESCO2-like isoform X2 n=1 Tax=Eriocheir sinensis TaxID=95602 RepID=UPI0021C76281|nr:N-acetyltransferase ESCO2-like isoform X2 [Eriocheir sinensis]